VYYTHIENQPFFRQRRKNNQKEFSVCVLYTHRKSAVLPTEEEEQPKRILSVCITHRKSAVLPTGEEEHPG